MNLTKVSITKMFYFKIQYYKLKFHKFQVSIYKPKFQARRQPKCNNICKNIKTAATKDDIISKNQTRQGTKNMSKKTQHESNSEQTTAKKDNINQK